MAKWLKYQLIIGKFVDSIPRALVHELATDMNNIRKCNQSLLEKPTPKI